MLSRDDVKMKPHPEGIFQILGGPGFRSSNAIFVGDQPFDIEAGIRAGISTVLLRNNYGEPKLGGLRPNYIFDDMSHLVSHVDTQQHVKPRYNSPVFETYAIAA